MKEKPENPHKKSGAEAEKLMSRQYITLTV